MKLIWTVVAGFFLPVVAFMMLTGCDAYVGKLGALGSSAHVMCYSGGVLIYEGYSTGKIISEANSDGYAFKDKADGRLKEVSGNCILEYE